MQGVDLAPLKRTELWVVVPTIAYCGLHVAGYFWPQALWGVDQLYYFPGFIGVMMLVCFSGLVVLHLPALRYIALAVVRKNGRWVEDHARANYLLALAALGLALSFFYIWRVQGHFLGDSEKWFKIFESLTQRPNESVGGVDPRHVIPVLGYIPLFEPLDVVLHYQVFRIGHTLIEWRPQDAYAALSYTAGVAYILVAWKTSKLLHTSMLVQYASLGTLLSMGMLQFFCGYGESYTLVTAASAYYIYQSLRTLQTRRLWPPMGALVLSCGLHLIALSLLPSFVYLCWRVRWNWQPRHPKKLTGALLFIALPAAVHLYTSFYPHPLPLLPGSDPAHWWVLGHRHLAVLGNVCLLICPFGLLWMLSGVNARRHAVARRFLALVALPGLALFLLHNAFLGARDWDLLGYPLYAVTLLGVLSLLSGGNVIRRATAILVISTPLMALHTALWIRVNSDIQVALKRLGNILGTSNHAPHYLAYVRGHYHLNLAADSPEKAEEYLRDAIRLLPPDVAQAKAGIYYRFLGRSLLLQEKYESVMVALDEAFEHDAEFVFRGDERYLSFWIYAALSSAQAQARARDIDTATGTLERALDRCDRLLAHDGRPEYRRLCGATALDLGLIYTRDEAGYERAIELLHVALRLQTEKMPSTDFLRLGRGLRRAGDHSGASLAFREAVNRDTGNRSALLALGRSYLDLGMFASAQESLSRLNRESPGRDAHLSLALAHYLADDITSAKREYSAAFLLYGTEGTMQVEALEDLRRFADIEGRTLENVEQLFEYR